MSDDDGYYDDALDRAEAYDDTRPSAAKGGGGGGGRGKAGKRRAAKPAGNSGASPATAATSSTPAAAASTATSTTSDHDATGGKFPTAESVYNQMRWDPRFTDSAVVIGYEDRYKGLLHTSIAKFRAGLDGDEHQIPFHRVRQFIVDGTLVWDREKRLCTVGAGSGSGAAAVSRPADTAVTSFLSDCRGTRLTVTPPSDSAAVGRVLGPQQKLRVLNFNVLHDLFDKEKIYTAKRIPLIAALLESIAADVVLLQEATPPFLAAIREASAALVGNYYWTSLPSDVNTVQMTLSKFPITEAACTQTTGKKRCVYATVQLAPGNFVVTANCHLLSDFGANPIIRRTAEFSTITKRLDKMVVPAIVSGDFNFGDQNEEQRDLDWKGYTDAWLAANGHYQRFDPSCELVAAGNVPQRVSAVGGFTYDLSRNWIADAMSRAHRYPRRLDRTLLRGLRPVSCRVVGDVPTKVLLEEGQPAKDLFPSDHFGLLTECVMDDDAAVVERTTTTVESSSHAAGKASSSSPAAAVGAAAAAAKDDNDSDAAASAMPPPPPSSLWLQQVPASSSVHGLRDSLLQVRPHFRTALVVLVPEALRGPIDHYRATMDKAYPRWMPHITLQFPFVPFGDLDQAAELLRVAAAAAPPGTLPPPFKIRLNRVGSFPGKRSVLFLDPDTPAKGAELAQLYGFADALFPAVRRSDRDGFHPHVTLGQCSGGERVKQTKRITDEFAKKTEGNGIEFDVTSIALIAHYDDKPGYEVVHTLSLEKYM